MHRGECSQEFESAWQEALAAEGHQTAEPANIPVLFGRSLQAGHFYHSCMLHLGSIYTPVLIVKPQPNTVS